MVSELKLLSTKLRTLGFMLFFILFLLFISAICRCEKVAAGKGFKYISFRYFGVCHGLKELPKEKSDFCVHHSFEQCMKQHDRCVGADDAEFVYRVTLKPAVVNPGSTVSQYLWILDHKLFRVQTSWQEQWKKCIFDNLKVSIDSLENIFVANILF